MISQKTSQKAAAGEIDAKGPHLHFANDFENDVAPGPKIRALIVDDHSFVRRSASAQLRHLGVEFIVFARNGREAREKMDRSTHRFDVILCDLNMPQEDGPVFLRWLSECGSRAAVILMTTVDSVVLDAAKQLGLRRNLNIVGVLEKPLSIDRLRMLLKEIASQQPSAPEERGGVLLEPSDIRECLEADLFEVWFQPQIETRSGRLHGFEALLRLRHPVHGLVGPGSFIGPAEKSGDIGRLTEFVFDDCIGRYADWRSENRRFRLSINLSARALNDLSFPDEIADMCGRGGVGPENFTLELTESSLAGNPIDLLDIMVRLRLKRFRLSIDDFGTGFSSLEQLKGLPFHELKIDKSFVQDAPSNPRARTILRNSLRLAAELNLATVAEGVETVAHHDLLTELGCDITQGFLIAKPMPGDAVIDWLGRFRSPT